MIASDSGGPDGSINESQRNERRAGGTEPEQRVASLIGSPKGLTNAVGNEMAFRHRACKHEALGYVASQFQ
ncbi:hypothetical protein PproGo58_50110 [Pseudomonas protegens]|nr:hypothetical protein PproGo58_50110 [Pseudomonas protegens]